MQAQAAVITRVAQSLTASRQFISTASLAKGIGCDRGQVLDALADLEAAGIPLMRIRGIGGGAQFIGKRMRRTA